MSEQIAAFTLAQRAALVNALSLSEGGYGVAIWEGGDNANQRLVHGMTMRWLCRSGLISPYRPWRLTEAGEAARARLLKESP